MGGPSRLGVQGVRTCSYIYGQLQFSLCRVRQFFNPCQNFPLQAAAKPGYVPPTERPDVRFVPALLDEFMEVLQQVRIMMREEGLWGCMWQGPASQSLLPSHNL